MVSSCSSGGCAWGCHLMGEHKQSEDQNTRQDHSGVGPVSFGSGYHELAGSAGCDGGYA